MGSMQISLSITSSTSLPKASRFLMDFPKLQSQWLSGGFLSSEKPIQFPWCRMPGSAFSISLRMRRRWLTSRLSVFWACLPMMHDFRCKKEVLNNTRKHDQISCKRCKGGSQWKTSQEKIEASIISCIKIQIFVVHSVLYFLWCLWLFFEMFVWFCYLFVLNFSVCLEWWFAKALKWKAWVSSDLFWIATKSLKDEV